MKTMYFFTIKLRKTKRLLTKIMDDAILLFDNNVKEMVLCRGSEQAAHSRNIRG